MSKSQQTYQYKKGESILGDLHDDYQLTQEEFYKLYSFYVTFSMCGNQSAKKRTFIDYGWESETIKNSPGLENALARVINFRDNDSFVFTDKNDLGDQFMRNDLTDGELTNIEDERAVIGKTEGNRYLKLFYRVRDGFAHGKHVLRETSTREKMVIIQDDNGHNVTARIVIKLSTLLRFVEVIDINNRISC